MPASWTRSAIPGVLRTPCRRRANSAGPPQIYLAPLAGRGRIASKMRSGGGGLTTSRMRRESPSPRPSPREERGEEHSIPPLAIDDVVQRAARFKTFDLPRDVFRNLVGIGVGGVVRRQHDLWVGPERTVLW